MGLDPDKNTMFLHQIPKYISTKSIFSIVSDFQGFLSMYLSEPIRSQNNIRYCWVNFEDEKSLQNAIENISRNKPLFLDAFNNKQQECFKLNPTKSDPLNTKKIKVTPLIDANRLPEDIIITKKLIEKFDALRGINVILENNN